jgi:hypothetical protein
LSRASTETCFTCAVSRGWPSFNPLISHYSWRHATKTRLDKVPGVSADLARYVTGAAPVDIHAGTYVHPSTDDIKRAIDGLIDPTL